MKIILTFFVALGCFLGQATAQDTSLYQKKVFYKYKDSMPYRLLLPAGFDSTKKYPVILFLHGSGERGNDNAKQLVWGSGLFLGDSVRKNFPAIVVFPQCSAASFWSNVIITGDEKSGNRSFQFQRGGEPTKAMELVMGIEKDIERTYLVDTNRLYVMGISMGGMGTFEIVRRMPNHFAAAIPICGGADTTSAKTIRKTAFWIFHGAADNVVPVQFSRDMIIALQAFYSSAEMQYTEYPGVGHNSWEKAFAEPELLPWLFSQYKGKK